LSSTPRALVVLVAAIAVALSASIDAAGRTSKAHATQRASSGSAHAKPSRKAIAAARARVHPMPVIAVPLADPRAVSHDSAAIAREFDQWLVDVGESGGVAGLAATIVKDDKVLLERGIGYADWASGEPVHGETVFRLASLSKAFAAAIHRDVPASGPKKPMIRAILPASSKIIRSSPSGSAVPSALTTCQAKRATS
jgi:beta-lactamase class C